MSQEHTPLPRAARRVAEALRSRGHEGEIRLLDESARSAAEAADALGVSQQQIVKSLVFRARHSDQPILALVGGTSRVDPQLLADHVGEPVDRAEADWVREQTGFAIGGVPPVGHSERLRTVADTALVELAQLWAAAGTPHAVFPLRGDQLARLTGAELAPIASSATS
jgi:prolyl-tRNA editing enzyme YbaK/EbsC (Cys-tRNA(Pro) deacylase)